MASPDTPQIPQAPGFQQDPFATQNLERLTEIGAGLTSGAFLDPSSSLGFLAPTVSLRPEITQIAADLATRSVERTRGRAQQDIINQLEANNQLTSSAAACWLRVSN